MDIKSQSQGFVSGFVAFLKKVNAAQVAIGIAVGVAVVNLVNGIMSCFITPLLNQLGGKDSYGGSFKIWVFEVGNFVGVLINFVAVMLVLYILGKAFVKDDPK